MSLAARVIMLMAVGGLAASEAAAQCSVHASGLNFGIYRGRAAATGTGTITVTCPAGTVFEIALTAGDGNYARRILRDAHGGAVTYNLYTSANFTRVWGDGIAPGTHTVHGVGQGGPAVFHVYGRIDRGQTPPPGTYSTTLTVTIRY
jgi:spore coat protein U-like protein